jgi:formiminotetrahydrofolate cyclodeaminase
MSLPSPEHNYFQQGAVLPGMTYADRPIGQFLDDIASEKVIPAGGTAAAVAGATGAALCEMACIHTVRKDEHADVAPELADVGEDLRTRRAALLALADSDADAVETLLATVEDGAAADTAEKRAVGVPLAIAEACLDVLDQATVVVETGTERAVPDAVTGAFLAWSALQAATFTVRTNLARIEDPAFVESTAEQVTDLDASAESAVEAVLATVEGNE